MDFPVEWLALLAALCPPLLHRFRQALSTRGSEPATFLAGGGHISHCRSDRYLGTLAAYFRGPLPSKASIARLSRSLSVFNSATIFPASKAHSFNSNALS